MCEYEQELSIKGSANLQAISTFHYDTVKDRVTVLRGCPPCPVCFTILTLENSTESEIGTHWRCQGCGTIWLTPDLIEAINGLITTGIITIERE